MQSATQQLIQHGYLLLFLISFIERVGIPLLVTPFVVGAGALAGAGRMNLALIVLVTVFPCVVADGGWFWLGRKKGVAVLKLICRLSLERDSCVRRTQAFTARHAGWLLIYSKFIPGVGRVAPPMAGVAEMKPLHFWLWETAGATIWTLVFVLVGYTATASIRWPRLSALLLQFVPALLLLAVIGNIAWKYVRRRMFIRSLRAVRISPEELKSKLGNDDLIVIDLRHFLDTLHDPQAIPGALQIYPEDLEKRYHEIPAERDIVLYCT
jgi:membrane protein DedA with SNARE-associated domain